MLAVYAGSLGTALGQAALTGTVTDSSAAVVAGATVTATNVATGVNYGVVTNTAGIYALPAMPPGQYQLKCQLSGFKTLSRPGLLLETGATRVVDLRLEIGDVTEAVTVSSSAPILDAERSTVGQLVERSMLSNMPLESRRLGSLIRLVATVTFREEGGGGEALPFFSLAGGRSHNQMWQLDGGVIQNITLGVAHILVSPPAESLQEFQVQTNNYPAELGRSGGGVILMTTRSGTDRFHGSAYEFLRNDRLDARTFFARGKAPLRYNIFGGAIGGPIRHDKTFFFFNYEGSRRRDGVTYSGDIVPRPAEVGGDFSARKDVTILDPLTRTPFAGNFIPASRLDPVGQKIARLYPAPNVRGDDTQAPRADFVNNASNPLTQDFWIGRVDHSLGDKNRLYVRPLFMRTPDSTTAVFPQRFADPRAVDEETKVFSINGSWIRNISPGVVNDLKFTDNQLRYSYIAAGVGSGENGQLGLTGVNADWFGVFNVTGLTALGAGTLRHQSFATNEVKDGLTWVHGKHQVKTGFEYRYSLDNDLFRQSSGGQFTFSNRATGDGLATLLLGWTTSASLVETGPLNLRSDYYAAFVQDDWKMTPKLTFNLGLRWEMDTPRWEQSNRQSGFDMNAVNPVSGTPGVITFAGQDGKTKYAHGFDKNNFGPRVGFAYRVRDRLVVRGAYGVSYNPEYFSAVIAALFNGFGVNSSFNSPDGGFTPVFLLRNGVPVAPAQKRGPDFGAVRVGEQPRSQADFFANNHVNGYAQQWNLTVQKELAGNMLIETAYLANVGHKLGGPDVSLNMIPLVNGRGPAQQDQRLRPFPQFSDVVSRSPSWGNSTYHALSVKLDKRYANGLNLLTSYTWSKFLDDVPAVSELGGGGSYTHIQLRSLDKSYSGNDIRHRYTASAVYDLPFGRGRHWGLGNPVLSHIGGGWGLGLIVDVQSGTPYGVVEQTNLTNTFSAAQRPNLLHDPTITGGRSRSQMLQQYFDTMAFQPPGIGVFGDAAREVGFGPGYLGMDLSVHKRWDLNERMNLLFRSDFYNLMNRPNFGNPNTVRGRGDFGSVTGILPGSTGRRIQLSLRLEF